MRAFALSLVLAFLAAACAPAPAAKSPPAATVAPPASSAVTPRATAAASAPATTSQAYLGITLTDVRTGERFTLGGSAGKVVIVEGMAVW